MEMLKLTEISYRYEEKPLLKDVSFTLGEHELLCLLGPSGSGKSTLLRLIAGLEKPENGSIFWDDLNLATIPTHLRNFGLMFQDYALFPHRNVFENVAFGLRMQKKSKQDIRKRVTDCLKQVGMETFANRKVTELSGGEQQRIALARALAPQPRMLMLDEPLGALDHTLRQTLIGELRHVLGENGIPTIYVTHDQEEAFALADKIALLHDGNMIQIDNPENLYRFPQSVWSAKFLGLNNILPGEVDDDGLVTVKMEDQKLSIPPSEKLMLRKRQKVAVLFQKGFIKEETDETDYSLRGKVKESVFRGTEFEIRLTIGEGNEFSLRHTDSIPGETIINVGYKFEDLQLLLI